ncbi:energy transducer TonB [Sulfurovum mangrovi]|uniref:energy transducer TonB n=1 Tax=Sulfurovum mangrovi TaxID=2893889 RepID=UPI001E40A884|nr:TonB family protein [Sulfurovum mangrovi]UFH59023.1 TonB family protein [Sulfurovum mangrovi]
MTNYRFLFSFLVTSISYIVVGFSLFYFSQTTNISDTKSSLNTIELTVQAFQPQVIEKEPEPIKEETPEPEEKVEETPLPEPEPEVEQPKPVEIPKPKPLPKKEESKKPEPPKEKAKVKKEKPKKHVKKSTKKCSPAEKRSALKSSKKQRSSANEKNLFLAKVRDRINRNKSYPRVAKRRGMQGSVEVNFTILPNGHVSAIAVSGSRVFHTSAKKAVEKAFPVSVKNIPMKLPEKVSITLHYRLSR